MAAKLSKTAVFSTEQWLYAVGASQVNSPTIKVWVYSAACHTL